MNFGMSVTSAGWRCGKGPAISGAGQIGGEKTKVGYPLLRIEKRVRGIHPTGAWLRPLTGGLDGGMWSTRPLVDSQGRARWPQVVDPVKCSSTCSGTCFAVRSSFVSCEDPKALPRMRDCASVCPWVPRVSGLEQEGTGHVKGALHMSVFHDESVGLGHVRNIDAPETGGSNPSTQSYGFSCGWDEGEEPNGRGTGEDELSDPCFRCFCDESSDDFGVDIAELGFVQNGPNVWCMQRSDWTTAQTPLKALRRTARSRTPPTMLVVGPGTRSTPRAKNPPSQPGSTSTDRDRWNRPGRLVRTDAQGAPACEC